MEVASILLHLAPVTLRLRLFVIFAAQMNKEKTLHVLTGIQSSFPMHCRLWRLGEPRVIKPSTELNFKLYWFCLSSWICLRHTRTVPRQLHALMLADVQLIWKNLLIMMILICYNGFSLQSPVRKKCIKSRLTKNLLTFLMISCSSERWVTIWLISQPTRHALNCFLRWLHNLKNFMQIFVNNKRCWNSFSISTYSYRLPELR